MKRNKLWILMAGLVAMGLLLTANLPAQPYGNSKQQRDIPPEVYAYLLENYDFDNSGDLSRGELQAARADRNERQAERRAEMRAAADTNNDGVVSPEEREAMKETIRARVHERLLEHYDFDGNGMLDEDEKAFLREEIEDRPRAQKRRAVAQRLKEHFDVNQNGVLDPEEKEALRELLEDRPNQRPRTGPRPRW